MAARDTAQESPHLTEEADLGSGEKTPAERDTDAMIEKICMQSPAPLPKSAPAAGNAAGEIGETGEADASGAAAARTASDPSGNPPETTPAVMPRAGAT